MKKLLIICLFFLGAMPLWTDETAEDTPIRLKNRGFEIALLKTHVGFGNNFLAAKDVLQKTVIIDLDNLTKGFKTAIGVEIAPVAININWKDRWGFGFDLGVATTYGNIEISKNLLQLNQIHLEKFGVGAAAFLDVGIPTFFHIRKLKVKLRPAVFLPLAYAKPGMNYTFKEKADGFRMAIDYNMFVYAPFSLDFIETGDSFDLSEIPQALNTTTLGFDFNTNLEFPLFPWLDVGINLYNIPLKPSVLYNYMRMAGELFVDTSTIDFADLANGGKFPDDIWGYPGSPEDFLLELEYGMGEEKIMRPFKLISYVVYRPFKKHPHFLLIPSLGFSINPVYVQRDSIEGGLKVCMDLANMFITTLGVNYEDQLWKNSINFVINLKAIEVDFGLIFESQNFIKSWQGAGAGVNFGLKLGW